MLSVKLTQIGNDLGLGLPVEAASRLGVEEGDTMFLTDFADGYHVTSVDPDLGAQMVAAEQIIRKRRNVLRTLAE